MKILCCGGERCLLLPGRLLDTGRAPRPGRAGGLRRLKIVGAAVRVRNRRALLEVEESFVSISCLLNSKVVFLALFVSVGDEIESAYDDDDEEAGDCAADQQHGQPAHCKINTLYSKFKKLDNNIMG